MVVNGMAEGKQSNPKKVFFGGVLLLSLSTVLVKLIGFLYKIPMLSYLGTVGMGYFNSAYEIYALFCVISTAGLPVALSVLISASLAKGNHGEVQKIYRGALAVFLTVGSLGSAVMLLFAKQFCAMIRSEHAYACILSIAPTVFFVCLSSALRGYFQGHQRMLPTAISQVIEAVGKLGFGLLLARYALEQGYQTPTVAAFAGAGLTLGTVCSTGYLLFEKLRTKEAPAPAQILPVETLSYRSIWKSLSRLSIPMTLGASVVSLTKLVDMTMILRRLQAIGYTEALANEAYGSYTTLALSLYGLLPTLVNSVALPLVPMLSAAIARGDQEKQAQMVGISYRLTALFAIPSALGLSAFASPLLQMLFGNDAQAVAIASPLLSCLGVSVFLSCMITATNSVLHAYRVVNRPILALLAGAAVKVLIAYFLIGNPRVAMMGAPISTFFCNAVVVLFNLGFVEKYCKAPSVSSTFLRPFLAAAVAIGSSYALQRVLVIAFGAGKLWTLLSLLFAVFAYGLFACLFGAVQKEDILSLPLGAKLCRFLQFTHLLPKKEQKRVE